MVCGCATLGHMKIFTLISPVRKCSLLLKIIALLAIVALEYFGYLGTYLPIEIWNLLVVFLVISSLFNLVRFVTIASYRKRSLLPVGQRDNFVLGIDSLSTLAVFIVVAASGFLIFDIAFQTFITSISLFAVALVLIFRDYISNYLDSFRLMFSVDYQIGDYIRVSEFTKGIISDITFRATKLKTDEGDVLFIPNTKLMTSEVVNYSKTKFKRIIVPFSLPTSAVDSVGAFEERLKKVVLTAFPHLILEHKVFLRINNIQDWQTNFAFEVSVDQYSFSIEEQIIKAVYRAVLSEQSSAYTPETVLLHFKQNVSNT